MTCCGASSIVHAKTKIFITFLRWKKFSVRSKKTNVYRGQFRKASPAKPASTEQKNDSVRQEIENQATWPGFIRCRRIFYRTKNKYEITKHYFFLFCFFTYVQKYFATYLRTYRIRGEHQIKRKGENGAIEGKILVRRRAKARGKHKVRLG